MFFKKTLPENINYTNINGTDFVFSREEWFAIEKELREYDMLKMISLEDKNEERGYYRYRDGIADSALHGYALKYLEKNLLPKTNNYTAHLFYAGNLVFESALIYHLPYYYYSLATIAEMGVDSLEKAKSVKQMYQDYLDIQKNFKPDEIDNNFMQLYKWHEAVDDALKKVKN